LQVAAYVQEIVVARNRRYKDAQEKRERGGFVPLSYKMIRSHSYAMLSPHAVKLLNDLMAQYNGYNNGDLCAAWSVMKKRGWRSKSTLWKALKELRKGQWIEVARQGGKNRCSLYAFTFFAVDECNGKLEINSTHSPKGTWRLNEPATPLKLNSVTRHVG